MTQGQVGALPMADRIVVLQGGSVGQVGAPLDLYDNPANLFVATFIGSPSMNLIKGKARIINGEIFVDAGGILLPAGTKHTVAEGQDVTYGIRPEHIALADDGFEARVGVIEPTGSETMVFVHAGGNDMLVLFRERHEFTTGQTIKLKPRKDAAHIFDTATGKRV